jgi:hypothetical protein
LTPFDRSVGDETHGDDTTNVGGYGEQVGIEGVEAVISKVQGEVLTGLAYDGNDDTERQKKLTLSTASLDISQVRP